MPGLVEWLGSLLDTQNIDLGTSNTHVIYLNKRVMISVKEFMPNGFLLYQLNGI